MMPLEEFLQHNQLLGGECVPFLTSFVHAMLPLLDVEGVHINLTALTVRLQCTSSARLQTNSIDWPVLWTISFISVLR